MNPNDPLADDLRRRLRDSEAQLDSRTAARLRAARRAALQSAAAGPGRNFTPLWATACSAVAVAVIAGVVLQSAPSDPETAVQDTADADTELYENLEMLEFYENLEFYEWLAAQDAAGPA
ncbi:MAG: hypothetical protein V2J12_10585 [Gammaproteobacteria bacterium]|jgi:hypothetical protein|nr:hypothetical protein [Gammaproteobacteria bacterium]